MKKLTLCMFVLTVSILTFAEFVIKRPGRPVETETIEVFAYDASEVAIQEGEYIGGMDVTAYVTEPNALCVVLDNAYAVYQETTTHKNVGVKAGVLDAGINCLQLNSSDWQAVLNDFAGTGLETIGIGIMNTEVLYLELEITIAPDNRVITRIWDDDKWREPVDEHIAFQEIIKRFPEVIEFMLILLR